MFQRSDITSINALKLGILSHWYPGSSVVLDCIFAPLLTLMLCFKGEHSIIRGHAVLILYQTFRQIPGYRKKKIKIDHVPP